MDFKRRKHEQAVASAIAHELHRVMGPILPEMLATRNDIVCGVFSKAFDQYKIFDEAVAARILKFVPKRLAELNLKFADFNRQLSAAIRQGGDRDRRHHQPDGALNPRLYVTGRI
jgi:hypothetical protein